MRNNKILLQPQKVSKRRLLKPDVRNSFKMHKEWPAEMISSKCSISTRLTKIDF